MTSVAFEIVIASIDKVEFIRRLESLCVDSNGPPVIAKKIVKIANEYQEAFKI